MRFIDGFSKSSLELVDHLLFAEGQKNPLEGQCNQKKKRESQSQPRTSAQERADRLRASHNQGRDVVPPATRSQAAKKAAATRKKCKGTQ